MNFLKEIFSALANELKMGAFFLIVMLPIALVISAPIVSALIRPQYWWLWLPMTVASVWILLGDTIVGAVRKANQQRSN